MALQWTADRISQKGMIITDDVTYQPILDFDAYSDTIISIVRNSYPKFSLGIYGEWGTGKTTLMRVVEKSSTKLPTKSLRFGSTVGDMKEKINLQS